MVVSEHALLGRADITRPTTRTATNSCDFIAESPSWFKNGTDHIPRTEVSECNCDVTAGGPARECAPLETLRKRASWGAPSLTFFVKGGIPPEGTAASCRDVYRKCPLARTTT